MNKTSMNQWLSLILCVALIAAIALTAVGCEQEPAETPATEDGTAVATVKGEGATVFYFNVVDKDGSKTAFEIHTDKTLVGDALMELGLLEGEEGPYGLYVKKVNGITADYDTDGTYWAFYVNGEYGMTGVDLTEIEAGATYEFRVSK